jgi:hypothetical protein
VLGCSEAMDASRHSSAARKNPSGFLNIAPGRVLRASAEEWQVQQSVACFLALSSLNRSATSWLAKRARRALGRFSFSGIENAGYSVNSRAKVSENGNSPGAPTAT